MNKEWDEFESKKFKVGVEGEKARKIMVDLEAERCKFEDEKKTEEWSALGWKKKVEAEVALLATERKKLLEASERDNEKISLRNEIEKLKKEKNDVVAATEEARSHRQRSEQKEVETRMTLLLRDKELADLTSMLFDQEQMRAELDSLNKDVQFNQVEKAEQTRRLSEGEKKIKETEVARATAESLAESLMNKLTWIQQYGIVKIANSILNATELDEAVAQLMVAVRTYGYAQGYNECSSHVSHALKVQWDNSRAATHGSNTSASFIRAKERYDHLQIPVMDLVDYALSRDDYDDRLKDIFSEAEEEGATKTSK